jgi:acyl-coenzyme A synthetase/AMP-(fatty) acid ligase
MNMPSSDDETFAPRLVARARTRMSDGARSVDLAALATQSFLGAGADQLRDRSVLIASATQIAAAIAMIELDGHARRITIAPPDLKPDHLADVIEDAEVEAIVTDDPDRFAETGPPVVVIGATAAQRSAQIPYDLDTEWVLLTSGTSGRPKMVVHTLAALSGAIVPTPPDARPTIWATFYDIRRYGGLQIFLRAVIGGTDLVLSSAGECVGDHLRRLGACGVTSISGTPSHWRRVLMSQDRTAMAPRYIRLSGEIADQFVLDGLRAAYPEAAIGHAYASTEAGVGFAVDDGLEGFPAALVTHPSAELDMKVVDGSLRIRSRRAATRYLGRGAAALTDADGFVDTGDLVEQRGDRYHFVGRRGGIINVGGLKVNPEEVEAALNSHAAVRMSLVQARKNPLTGAIVVADVVLRDPEASGDDLRREILETCHARLERHKVPALIRFVPALTLTPGGKLSRANG